MNDTSSGNISPEANGVVAAQAAQVGRRFRRLIGGQEAGIFLVLVFMIVFFGVQNEKFLQFYNVSNIIRDFSWIAIPAFGATMVIITAGIDLSVGSVMALSGLAAGFLVSKQDSFLINALGVEVVPAWVVPAAVMLALCVGALAGLVNGALITYAKLPPFIATLGMLQIARGFCYGWSKGQPVQQLPQDFNVIGRHKFPIPLTNFEAIEKIKFPLPTVDFDFPLPTLIMLIIAVIAWLFLTRTVWGYRIFATGGNLEAAQLSGINTGRTLLLVYTIAGLLGGAGGILMTARLGVAAPTAAQGYELDVIAAVVVGGTSLMGGEGSILGTLIGAAIMGTLRTGLNMIGVDPYWLPVAQGIIIIAAITIDQWFRRRQGRRTIDWKAIADNWRELFRSMRTNIAFGDFVAVGCAVVLLVAFFLLPWTTVYVAEELPEDAPQDQEAVIVEETMTGNEAFGQTQDENTLIKQIEQDAPEAVVRPDELANPNMFLFVFPISGIAALVFALWGVSTPNFKRVASFLILVTGALALIYYLAYVGINGEVDIDTMDFVQAGFWVALVAAVGLIVQVFIPRSSRRAAALAPAEDAV